MEIMSLEDIIMIMEDGWEVRENSAKIWNLQHKERKGMNYPDINRIILYTNVITDENDYNITLMHELYHALNPYTNETETEELAQYTTKHYPEVVGFARDIFL